jgi:hypothetical protein
MIVEHACCVSILFPLHASVSTHAPKVLARLLATKSQGPWLYSDRIAIALFVVATRLHLLVGREVAKAHPHNLMHRSIVLAGSQSSLEFRGG